METTKRFILACILLLAYAEAATFANTNLPITQTATSPGAISWDGVLSPYGTPKISPAYVNKGDLVCVPSNQLSAMKYLPLLPAAQLYLSSMNIKYTYIALGCVSQPQNYYIFIYLTEIGLLRLNVYSYAGYTAVNMETNLDPNLYIRHLLPSPF